MEVEVLVSTMKKNNCINLVGKMNINTECLVVNQLGNAKINEKISKFRKQASLTSDPGVLKKDWMLKMVKVSNKANGDR